MKTSKRILYFVAFVTTAFYLTSAFGSDSFRGMIHGLR